MTFTRVLHVDDEADIREVVELSLGFAPDFATRSCGSGKEALVAAVESPPDIILLDVMMPDMDGPATLTHLRENPQTAHIPIIFMTAHAQKREVDYFKSLGAVGVIVKPFDPMTLAELVRRHVFDAKLDKLEDYFLLRLESDTVTLAEYRETLSIDPTSSAALEGLQSCAHKLAGSAGVYGFLAVSDAASSLEHSIIDRRAGRDTSGAMEADLSSLFECIERGKIAGSSEATPF